jgi:hypothetical protein
MKCRHQQLFDTVCEIQKRLEFGLRRTRIGERKHYKIVSFVHKRKTFASLTPNPEINHKLAIVRLGGRGQHLIPTLLNQNYLTGKRFK